MDSTPMPEPLRRAIPHLVSESVQNCQEVLRYTEPDQAHTWKRMTLYRATDAADTIDMMALLIAAYCEHTNMDPPRCRSASRVERSRSVLTAHEEDRAHVAGLMGKALSYEVMRAPTNRMRHHRGQAAG
ncbi:hypothetical protein ACRAR1_29345 [Streptomyces sanyensis]|uniref:hypothetical protein n=1 Tax=Streptomyces sanyensis TaxID=568869 RepID=UPI003D76F738